MNSAIQDSKEPERPHGALKDCISCNWFKSGECIDPVRCFAHLKPVEADQQLGLFTNEVLKKAKK